MKGLDAVNNDLLRRVAGFAAIALLALYATTYTVREEHAGLVSRFGKPVRTTTEAGLHWKLPWPIERAAVVDLRTRVFDTRHTEMLTRDKKNVILLSYAVWHVADPLRFYRAVGTLDAGNDKLDGLITNAKIGVLGRYDLDALVSTDEETIRTDAIEAEIREATLSTARDKYGIEVEQVGFRRLSLPEENTSFVFDQMRAERQQFAAMHRAQGEREAARIRSEADLEKARILAEANEEAARIRGDAEAEAATIYAKAHRADPEFYAYLRQLESLEKVLGKDATVIMRTDSEPFQLIKER